MALHRHPLVYSNLDLARECPNGDCVIEDLDDGAGVVAGPRPLMGDLVTPSQRLAVEFFQGGEGAGGEEAGTYILDRGVQAALNTPGVSKVKLAGTFNFGDPSNLENCSATINNPRITLEGEPGSKIDGGCDGVDVYAPGVDVRGLTLNGFGTFGIGVWANGLAGAFKRSRCLFSSEKPSERHTRMVTAGKTSNISH